jgi:oxygen-independent coproporphyrinogen-3 oxidase
VLAAVDRKAREADILNAVRLFREAGLVNFGIDLILGLQSCCPSVTPESALHLLIGDLHKAVSLGPVHISVYMLGIAEDTALGHMVSDGSRRMLDDATMEQMYLFAVEFLTEHGYEQYELSNFAIPGKESMHNIQYWRGGDYIGLGLGAVSTVGPKRTQNCGDLQEYVRLVHTGRKPLKQEERLTKEVLFTENVMLSLRMTEGLDIDALMGDVSEGCADRLQAYLCSLFKHGLAMKRDSRLVLTPIGLLRSNAVIADIVRITEIGKNRHS